MSFNSIHNDLSKVRKHVADLRTELELSSARSKNKHGNKASSARKNVKKNQLKSLAAQLQRADLARAEALEYRNLRVNSNYALKQENRKLFQLVAELTESNRSQQRQLHLLQRVVNKFTKQKKSCTCGQFTLL